MGEFFLDGILSDVRISGECILQMVMHLRVSLVGPLLIISNPLAHLSSLTRHGTRAKNFEKSNTRWGRKDVEQALGRFHVTRAREGGGGAVQKE